MSQTMTAVKARRLITPLQEIRDAVILIQGERFVEVGQAGTVPIPDGAPVLDAGDGIVIPGLVDIHHHGAMGVWASEGPDALRAIARFQVSAGTTTWLPTVDDLPSLPVILQVQKEGTGAADIGGIHMEGPFLAPKAVPGQEVMDVRLLPPSVPLLREFIAAAQGQLLMMGLSQELPGALEVIRALYDAGIVAACAHSKGNYESFLRGVEAGIRHVTHTYNVMTGFHHRRPGIVGGTLTCDQVTAEITTDNTQVSPTAVDILLRCKGPDQVALITDNVPPTGLPDGVHHFFGRTIVRTNGLSRMAGSTADQDNVMIGGEAPFNQNVGNVVRLIGARLRDAVRMATLTPATVVGIHKRKGSIEPGKDADLLIVDEDVSVRLTMVRGKVVFQATP